MPIALSLLLVLFFLLMNAFFVAAEFSLVRVRKSQVEILVDEGRKGAKYTKLVADNVNAYLSACQLGITLASLALGWLGEPAVSALFEPLFKALNVPEAATHGISIVIGFVIITALHIVVGVHRRGDQAAHRREHRKRTHRPRAERIRGQHLRPGRQRRRGHHDAAHRCGVHRPRRSAGGEPPDRAAVQVHALPGVPRQQGPHRRLRAREGPLHDA